MPGTHPYLDEAKASQEKKIATVSQHEDDGVTKISAYGEKDTGGHGKKHAKKATGFT